MLIGIKKNRGGIPMVGGSAFHFVKVLFNGKLPNLKMIKKKHTSVCGYEILIMIFQWLKW